MYKINNLSKICDKIVKPLLEKYDFIFDGKEVSSNGCFANCYYRKGDLYIKILADASFEIEPHSNVILGEGSSDDFNESDWNSIALWRLINEMTGNKDAGCYFLKNENDLENQILQAKKDLEQFGKDFLKGDIKLFRKVRAEQNKMREPYKVYEPNGKGRYNMSIDKKSEDMKSRFSKE